MTHHPPAWHCASHQNTASGFIHTRSLRIAFASILVLAMTQGCTQIMWALADPSGINYVHRVGGPREIGNWALRQQDLRRVRHANLALVTYCFEDSTDQDRSQAIQAYIRIDEKLATGWGGKFPRDDPKVIDLRRGMRNAMLWSDAHDVQIALLQLPSYFDWLGGVHEVASWALSQPELEDASHSRYALLHFLSSDRDAQERAAAVEAYLRLDEKLASGWDGQYALSNYRITHDRRAIRTILQAACLTEVEEACGAMSELEGLVE